MKLWDHTHTAAELQSMPIDALAMLVLHAFAPDGWNVDSFFKEAEAYQNVY